AASCGGGAMPEVADCGGVIDDEKRTVVGTLDEDFAVESNAGDIFLLGNSSWRVKHVRGGEVVVTDAHGAPPTIPFWRGEAPGRSFELSAEVGRLREEIVTHLKKTSLPEEPAAQAREGEEIPCLRCGLPNETLEWLEKICSVDRHGAEQALNYVAIQFAATGMVPTQHRLLFERFFDESGGMQLVIHAP